MKRALDIAFLGGLALIYLGLGWALWRTRGDEVRAIALISYGGSALCVTGVLLRGLGMINLDLILWAREKRKVQRDLS